MPFNRAEYWKEYRRKNAGRWTLKKSDKPIKPISKNRQEALKRYRRLREKYFEEHPVCEYPGCNSREVTLHHMKGREGCFLTDKRYFKSLCWPHHRHVEENPLEAKRLNLSINRLNKAS